MDAQGVRVSGRVLRWEADAALPVPGVFVVLHHMTQQDAGPVDSARTDASGGYRFSRPAGDSGRLLVTVRHDGVAYVSEDAVRSGMNARIPQITVNDTSSTVPVVVAHRHVLVRGAEPDGSRAVLELLVLRNPSRRTRVAPGGGEGTTWATRLLRGAIDALVPGGQGDIGADATQVSGDSLAISAPLPPGDRQLVVSYVLPASGRLVLPVDGLVNQVTLMLADTSAAVGGGTLASTGVASFEGERYLRLEAKDLAPGDTLVVELTPAPLRLEALWWLVVVASAGVLVAAALRWWRVPLAEAAGQP